jgi:zeaxanthin glucosyltransferase
MPTLDGLTKQMTHIGIICTPVPGHLNPMTALGRELQDRGHKVTLFQIPDTEALVRAEAIDFWPIGLSDFPIGRLPKDMAQLGKLSGLKALKYTIDRIRETTEMICRDAPEALRKAGVEFLLVDQQEPAAASVAEYLELPFVTVCNALAINHEPNIPPFFTTWKYQSHWFGRMRNRVGYSLFEKITAPISTHLNIHRSRWGLRPLSSHFDSFSQLAQICQLPQALDFPRHNLPHNFHYTGPFRQNSPRQIPFPYEQLTGAPLIYASLGTLQNRRKGIFYQIAEACKDIQCQLVVSLGAGSKKEDYENLPGNPLIVSYAPQLELLKKATLTITHAGLNTVLESLANGVPMVAIPITNDQPGVASRLTWSGAGKMIHLSQISSNKLRHNIEEVLNSPTYLHSASKIQKSIQQAGGSIRAANIIESAIQTRLPVTSTLPREVNHVPTSSV